MRWKIWGRQAGKSYDIMQWWLESPEKRFILCGSANLVRARQDDVWRAYDEQVRRGWNVLLRPAAKKLIEDHILSVSQWKGKCGPGYCANASWEFAVDDAELTISQLVGANVEIVAGCGVNDKPDPAQLAKLEEFFERYPDERQHY